MDTTIARPRGVTRLALALLIVLATLASGAIARPSLAQEESAAPSASPTAAEALCDSVDDLGLVVAFLQTVDVEQDGLVPIAVGAVAGIAIARDVLDLTVETYRPLVQEIRVGFEDLRAGVDELEGEGTIGSKIEAVAQPIADIGSAMDALSVQLSDRCSA